MNRSDLAHRANPFIQKARDILSPEIVPLGPLNGKSFMTSISPWVVTLDALAPFAVPSPPRDGPVAPYLHDPAPNGTYDVELQAEVIVDGRPTRICTAKLQWMYWSFRSIFAHQCIGGCGVASGDIVATGYRVRHHAGFTRLSAGDGDGGEEVFPAKQWRKASASGRWRLGSHNGLCRRGRGWSRVWGMCWDGCVGAGAQRSGQRVSLIAG